MSLSQYQADRGHSHQHVLSKPSLISSDHTGNSKSETLLPKQRVAAVTASVGGDFTAFWEVANHNLIWIARPVVDHLP